MFAVLDIIFAFLVVPANGSVYPPPFKNTTIALNISVISVGAIESESY